MQKIAFADCIRIQINQAGLKQILILSCLPSQTPTLLPKRKRTDYKKKRSNVKIKETERCFPNLSPIHCGTLLISLLSRLQWQGGGKYAIWNREGNTGRGKFHYSIVLFILPPTSPIARAERDNWTARTHTHTHTRVCARTQAHLGEWGRGPGRLLNWASEQTLSERRAVQL